MPSLNSSDTPVASNIFHDCNELITSSADIINKQDFFSHQQVISFYKKYAENEQTQNEAIRALAPRLSQVPLPQAALLTLLCGCFVEDNGDPTIAFAESCHLMHSILKELSPYFAQKPEEDADDNDNKQIAEQWLQVQTALAQLTESQRQSLEYLQQASETLVLPMMAMLMRNTENYRQFIQHTELLALIERGNMSECLELGQLYYLDQAAKLTYDEIVVVLPESQSGILVQAHAVNNVFHAMSLLQPLLALHGKTLNLGKLNPQVLNTEESESARFHWLSALAYKQGKFVDGMAMAWGECSVYDLPRRHDKLVMIALEKEVFINRSWNGFCHAIHDAQNPAIEFKRYLTADEVKHYLD